MEDEPSPEKAPAGTSWRISIVTVAAWLLAIGCGWFLMTASDDPKRLIQLICLGVAFAGAMYFVKRRRSFAGVMIWGVVAFSMLFFSAPTMNIEKARKLTALSVATSIESAVNRFHMEYGIFPDVGSRLRTGSKEGFRFLTILSGYGEPPGSLQNFRGIRFLTVREVKNYKGGMMVGPGGNLPDGLFDPWGRPYVVMLDARKEGKLHFNYGSKTVDLSERRVAVFSTGKDGVEGNSDDVKTWGN